MAPQRTADHQSTVEQSIADDLRVLLDDIQTPHARRISLKPSPHLFLEEVQTLMLSIYSRSQLTPMILHLVVRYGWDALLSTIAMTMLMKLQASTSTVGANTTDTLSRP